LHRSLELVEIRLKDFGLFFVRKRAQSERLGKLFAAPGNPGIAADALPRLCDPEFSTKDGGSGIGLHVARAIVELHGGEFRIESDLGRGTDVLVLMPLAEGGA